MLCKAKAKAKTKGDKGFGEFSEWGEDLIHNPTLVQMHLINPKDLKDWNSDEEEDKGKEKMASGRDILGTPPVE